MKTASYDVYGTSMLPTLKAGESVLVETDFERDMLLPGDIIIYKTSQEDDKKIAHRIFKKCPNGFITRGDNNLEEDDYLVEHGNILGKVLSVKRDGGNHYLKSGKSGRRLQQWLQIRKLVLKYILKIPCMISSWIDKSRIFNVFHDFIKIEIVSLKKGNKTKEIIIHKKKLIGKKCIFTGQWNIRFPYKFFINRNKL